VIGEALAADIVETFLSARFTNEERHRRRLDKVLKIEAGS
jgi:ribose 5-phosphate isomerase B